MERQSTMSDQITITLDDKQVKATAGERLLDVCRREGIEIPTLCDHVDVSSYGACRLCLVEWDRGDWSKMVTSCNFPVKDGQTFRTNSDKVVRIRNMIMQFTLARSSNVPEVVELAKKWGVTETKFSKQEEGCILCGNCVRACSEVVGANAIGFSERGKDRKVSPPLNAEAIDCIGCGSCAYVCPTNFIKVEETPTTRKFPLWNAEFEMVYSKKLGQKIPRKQIEFVAERAGLPIEHFEIEELKKK